MSAANEGRLVHHELCFGCGRTNLFGLLAELKATGPRAVAGRCFVKQDHQGAEPGRAHDGIIATALLEAMSFVAGPEPLRRLEIEFVDLAAGERVAAPIGAFLELEAQAQGTGVTASASTEGRLVARAIGTYGQDTDA